MTDRVTTSEPSRFGGNDAGRFVPPALPSAFWLVIVVIVIGFVASLGLGSAEAETFVLLLLFAWPIGMIAKSLARPIDYKWLPTLVMAGWAAKLVASAGRYWALQVLYNGVGDASGYHAAGIRNAPIWRSLQIPQMDLGTHFVEGLTGLLYVPHIPTKLGGFFLFATLAFLGQVLLYAAFRRMFPSPRVIWYCLLIFFFPNIVYWPSSIGKDSLMTLFIGITAYGAARLFVDYRPAWITVFAIGIAGAGAVRSHIALALVLSAGAAIALGRAPKMESARTRRLIALVLLTLVLAFAVQYAISDFGIDLTEGISDSLIEEELATVEQQTDTGGSAVEGSAIRTPADIPQAVLRVVFRPLPYDAHNLQALANSLVEGSVLLLLFIWRAPAIIRHTRRHWREPYLLMSIVYTAGFIFGHSAILNLAIIARQRSQLIPFVLVILVELGAMPTRTKTSEPVQESSPDTVTSPGAQFVTYS